MTPREQLIQEVLQAPDVIVGTLLKLLRLFKSGQTDIADKLAQVAEITEAEDSSLEQPPILFYEKGVLLVGGELPAQAQQIILENLKTFEKMPLVEADYTQAIAQMVRLNLPGGGIFDALIAKAVTKSEAEILLTLNPKHFVRLSQEVADRVEVPS